MQIQPLDPPIARPLRLAVQGTAPPLESGRSSGHHTVPSTWCYQCGTTGCSRHDREARPSTLVRTAERIADRTLMDAEMPEPGNWDAGHVALVRAIIAELSMLVDVAEQVAGR